MFGLPYPWFTVIHREKRPDLRSSWMIEKPAHRACDWLALAADIEDRACNNKTRHSSSRPPHSSSSRHSTQAPLPSQGRHFVFENQPQQQTASHLLRFVVLPLNIYWMKRRKKKTHAPIHKQLCVIWQIIVILILRNTSKYFFIRKLLRTIPFMHVGRSPVCRLNVKVCKCPWVKIECKRTWFMRKSGRGKELPCSTLPIKKRVYHGKQLFLTKILCFT